MNKFDKVIHVNKGNEGNKVMEVGQEQRDNGKR